ncbi:hypothetical protein GCM10027075_22900 [Streptomyces heilongjiangensis]
MAMKDYSDEFKADPVALYDLFARVSVDFRSKFDAGVLLLWQDDRTWAKLCFEYSPSMEGMVVPVVAREFVDDANAFDAGSGPLWLRIARMGRVIALHASLDGESWRGLAAADPDQRQRLPARRRTARPRGIRTGRDQGEADRVPPTDHRHRRPARACW